METGIRKARLDKKRHTIGYSSGSLLLYKLVFGALARQRPRLLLEEKLSKIFDF